MISLEQVKLLDSKVARTIDYVKKVIDENRQLKENLSSYQKRIDELDILVSHFRQDQNRIEDGILSALDRLNQFEGAVETLLSAEGKLQPPVAAESKLPTESKFPAESKAAPVVEVIPSEKLSGVPAMEEDPLPDREISDREDEDSRELDIF
jgi:hypothetical protein